MCVQELMQFHAAHLLTALKTQTYIWNLNNSNTLFIKKAADEFHRLLFILSYYAEYSEFVSAVCRIFNFNNV